MRSKAELLDIPEIEEREEVADEVEFGVGDWTVVRGFPIGETRGVGQLVAAGTFA